MDNDIRSRITNEGRARMSSKNRPLDAPDLWHAGLNQWILYVTNKTLMKQLEKDKRYTVCGVYMNTRGGVIAKQFKFDGGMPLLKKSSRLGEVMNEHNMKWKFLKYIKPRVVTNSDPECTLTYKQAEQAHEQSKSKKM